MHNATRNNSTQQRRTDAFDSLSVRYAHSTNTTRTPLPGRTPIYGAILKDDTGKFALVKGRQTGKWSFPKGHVNRYETPFECVCREINEEIGLEELPIPINGVPLKVGYYYYFTVDSELELNPKDTNEVEEAGWFSITEMSNMDLNVDASTFLTRERARPKW